MEVEHYIVKTLFFIVLLMFIVEELKLGSSLMAKSCVKVVLIS